MSDNEVKFSSDTLAVLKKLNKINQCLKIPKNSRELRSLNETRTTAAYINIEEELPRDFCIYDIGEFITVLSIIQNPIVDFSNPKYVTIKSEDGSQKLKYLDASEDVINSYTDKVLKVPSEDVTINVSAAHVNSVLNAAKTLKLEFVGFTGDGEKVYISAFSRNNGDGQETNDYSIEVAETTEVFKLFYKTEALQILDGEATFVISKKKISEVQNGKFKYFITLDAKSEFR